MQTRCVNDTNGDGDCAVCARDPQAPCRVPAEHTTGRLTVADVAARHRKVFGALADELATMFGQPLRGHDWRFKVHYTRPDGRTGTTTYHRGATADHVAADLAREGIVLVEPPTVPERVDSACCGGTGYADYAAVRCPAPDCPVPEAQWRVALDTSKGDDDAR